MTASTEFGRRGVAKPVIPASVRNGARGAPPPSPAAGAPSGGSALAPLLHLFFSYKGRIRRRDYWLGHIAVTLALFLGLWLELSLQAATKGNPWGALLLLPYALALPVVGLWSTFAVQVKRWHDRDRSWPWLFIIFIPFIGGLWAFVELGCLDGTPGENRYGYSPKLGPAAAFA